MQSLPVHKRQIGQAGYPGDKAKAGPRARHASDESRAAQKAHQFDLHELQKLINRDHFELSILITNNTAVNTIDAL